MPSLLRTAILLILTLGLLGTGAELILLEHTEDFWQWLPVVLLGGALVLVGWVVLAPRRLGIQVCAVDLQDGSACAWSLPSVHHGGICSPAC